MVPHTSRPLLVPVSHTEYEWLIRGPRINAAIAFYFGIDGKAEFRTMDELNQAWVLGRHAHEYSGADAVEVTRLSGLMAVAYMHQHFARPALPFGGYYALGVCQDAVAAIEKKMTGRATLFPNTADTSLFDDPRDTDGECIAGGHSQGSQWRATGAGADLRLTAIGGSRGHHDSGIERGS